MASNNLQPPADGLRVRATAVAKLKRAASLPRMKDGRRPPMHGEAVSEGERATPSPIATPNLTDESREGSPLPHHDPSSEPGEALENPQPTQPTFAGEDDEDDPLTPQAHLIHSQSKSQSQPQNRHEQSEDSSHDNLGGGQDFEQDQDQEQEQDAGRSIEDEPESAPSRTTTPTTSQRKKKRRSRSRSRSRSKDLKEVMANLSRSEDEGSAAPPPVPPSPFLQGVQPPTGFTTPILQAGWPYVPPQSPHFFAAAPTSPSPLPSFDAILRAGLSRSNSAAGRMMAFHKLTGGKESPEPMRLSPSPSPAPPLTRSNTVTGGERMAARNMMLRRLGERMKEVDGDRITEEPPSAEEGLQVLGRRPGTADALARASPAGSFDFLPQVKRSPQPSVITSVVDDREVSETPTSPAPRSRPLLIPESESSASTPVPENSAGYQSSARPDTSLSTSSAFGYSRRTTDGSRMGDQEPFEYDGAEVRDGVVIERDELEGGSSRNPLPSHFGSPPRSSPATSQMGLSGRFSPSQQPSRRPAASTRPSDTSSMLSAANAEPIPLFMSTQGERSPYKQDTFPVEFSPYGTTNKESIVTESESEVDDVIYPEDAKSRKAWFERMESDIGPRAWTGSPLMSQPSGLAQWTRSMQASRGPSEDDPPVIHSQSRTTTANLESDTATLQQTSYYDDDVHEEDQSHPVEEDFNGSPFPQKVSLALAETPSERTSRASESASLTSSSLQAPSFSQGKARDAQEFADWEDVQADRDAIGQSEAKEKRKGESTWQKMKAGLTRSGSSMGFGTGRRSRSNSFVNKPGEAQRESAASAGSGNGVEGPLVSASMLSLSANTAPPPRGGVSPVPPVAASDARYGDQKLMPFPGLAKLQEEKMQRSRGMSFDNGSGEQPEPTLERRPSISKSNGKAPSPSQGSDPPLSRSASQKVVSSERPMSPSRSGSVSGPSTSPLPNSREGVRRWLNLNSKKIFGTSPEGQTTNLEPTNAKSSERRPSISDLLSSNRVSDSASATEKEDSARMASIRAKTQNAALDTSSSTLTPQGPPSKGSTPPPRPTETPPLDLLSSKPSAPSNHPWDSPADVSHLRRPVDQQASSEKSARQEEQRTAAVLEKLDIIMEQAARDPVRASALDSPPRKLLLMSKAFQVLDRNTIKDRYLFLFTDILVIAKPMDDDHGNPSPISPLNQSFAVKSIVELSKLDFDPYREGEGPQALAADFKNHPSVRVFVQRFGKDPDRALSIFLEKTKLKDDPTTVANLLFRTLDLDKARLGEYLSRRNSKNVLKAFLDRFGFTGIRIDNALRAFLLSIRLPSDGSLVEHLLVTFASRWFEANMGVVAFDKELAARLVFAMMQLNDALHSQLDTDMTPAGGVFSFPNRNITSQDFIEACQAWDRRRLISDDVLEKIYRSIQIEKLAQAVDSSVPSRPTTIVPTRIPGRLTTRVPSEPITIRIPAPDPQFGLHLQGQDLLFEPPFLSFAESAEMSFRVIGNSLGTKTAIFARTGANANLYSGIPLSKTFNVERAFMRNTFRVAFTNHSGLSRKYLFSVESQSDHANWATSLERHIADCRKEPSAQLGGIVSVKVRRAAEAIALRVLRDALLVPDDPTKVEGRAPGTKPPTFSALPPLGAGLRPRPSDSGVEHAAGGAIPRGTARTGHDLVLACQQNSLIPLVLSFLNVVKPI